MKLFCLVTRMGRRLTVRVDTATGSFREVIEKSPANGAPYEGESLPSWHWAWPTDTYLQKRLSQKNRITEQ